MFTPRVCGRKEEKQSSTEKHASALHSAACNGAWRLADGAWNITDRQPVKLENSKIRFWALAEFLANAHYNADRRARGRQKTRRGTTSEAGGVRTSATSDMAPHDDADGPGAPSARTSERCQRALTSSRTRNPWRISWTLMQ